MNSLESCFILISLLSVYRAAWPSQALAGCGTWLPPWPARSTASAARSLCCQHFPSAFFQRGPQRAVLSPSMGDRFPSARRELQRTSEINQLNNLCGWRATVSHSQHGTDYRLCGTMECPVGMVHTPVSQLSMPLVGQQSLVVLEVTLPLLLLHTRRVAGLAGPPSHTLGSILWGTGGGSGLTGRIQTIRHQWWEEKSVEDSRHPRHRLKGIAAVSCFARKIQHRGRWEIEGVLKVEQQMMKRGSNMERNLWGTAMTWVSVWVVQLPKVACVKRGTEAPSGV